jgi:hypothetical protein
VELTRLPAQVLLIHFSFPRSLRGAVLLGRRAMDPNHQTRDLPPLPDMERADAIPLPMRGGLANRSWGPRDGLPAFLRFTEDQLLQLPPARSVLEPPDPQNAAAYVPIGRGAKALAPGETLRPELPPTADQQSPTAQAITRALLRQHMEQGRAAEAAAEKLQKERLGQLTAP